MAAFENKDIMNAFYDAVLITAGATVIGIASRRVAKDGLGTPVTPIGTGKLVLAAGLGSIGIQYLKSKKVLPNEWKSS